MMAEEEKEQMALKVVGMREDSVQDLELPALLSTEHGLVYQAQTKTMENFVRFKSTSANASVALSNFFPDNVNPRGLQLAQTEHGLSLDASFVLDDQRFRTSEAAYQFYKYQFVDPAYCDLLRVEGEQSALQVKLASGKGRYLKWRQQTRSPIRKKRVPLRAMERAFDSRLSEWNRKHSVRTMYRILREGKFNPTTQPKLCNYLLSTGNKRLGELGRMTRDTWAITGDNLLGRVLERVRADVIKSLTT